MLMMSREVSGKYAELFDGEFEFRIDYAMNGEENMKIDYDRTIALAEGNAKPMFRLYAWKPWCVSLGYNQSDKDIDNALLRSRGLDLVRRPTGGRAVLHADELTYSVVLKLSEEKNVHNVYRDVHLLLINGLNKLGIKLGFEKAQVDLGKFYKSSEMSVSCFASSARYEIEHEGRKIVGSAQRLFGDTLLQHGSILLDSGHERLAEVIKTNDDNKRRLLKKYMLSHSATISEAAGRKITYSECVDAIQAEVLG